MFELIAPYLFLLPPFFIIRKKHNNFHDLIKEISKSWLFFWSYYVLLGVSILIFIPKNFNPVFVFTLTLILYSYLKKDFIQTSYKLLSNQFLIFMLFFIISLTNEKLQISGDTIWSFVLSLDITVTNPNNIKFTLLGHRPIALPLISSLSVSAFKQIFFQFNIFTFLLLFFRFGSLLFIMINKNINNKLISFIAIATFLTSPVLLSLSFYWGNHLFIALGFLELILFFDNNLKHQNNIDFFILSSSLIFFRREVFLFIIIFFVYFVKKINKNYSLITFLLPIFWFLNLYFLEIPLQKSETLQFLLISLIMILFLIFYNFVNIRIFYSKLFIFLVLTAAHLVLIHLYGFTFWEIFYKNLLGLGGWGIIGTLMLFAIIGMPLIKRNITSLTTIIILTFQVLPYVNDQSGDGWRFGFTSSFNRILYYLLPIIIYEFLKEINNED
tara:strand:- start:222 stop:1544 length:1323 start_codon:yes stop_codon:yes gene_type:complete